ncbi:MAG: chromosomal replication initiator protein DnaA [Xanthomonadales bacterium]|nr:chromosomal replication initiator protein DnaA [Xanthomonadales bacterium]
MQSLWERLLERLESEYEEQDILTWLKPLQVTGRDGRLSLLAPNAFVLDVVRERFLTRIEAVARHLAGNDVQVGLEVGSSPRAADQQRGAAASPGTPSLPFDPEFESNLDAHYTFENFVEGKSNELGRAAAYQVALNPGRRESNPLLLYGGTGLGKTHLMYAAGNLMRRNNPGFRVLYQRSEQFVSAMIRALQTKTIDEFKNRYRSVDALLIDDIQFFANKDRTQEEFFHTFNALFESNQQIILTCDRYPKEVENLEPRLTSRLGWGLPVAIEPPDFETRAAILLRKAELKGIVLPEEVAFMIARRMRSHVRDLEGALNTLAARAHFTGRAITTEFAQEALRDLLTVQERTLSIPNIQRVTADYYQLRVSDLLGKRRTRQLARARQTAMALTKELTSHSLPEIGDAFGGRDHTTVLHACRLITELRETDGKTREDWDKLIRALTG